VVRIAELGDAIGPRDVFLAGGDPSTAGEGAFVPSGVVPRIAGELVSRGVKLDMGLFKKAAGRG
jgi:hypothetical protein